MSGGKPHSRKHKNYLIKNSLAELRMISGMTVDWEESLLVSQAVSSESSDRVTKGQNSAIKIGGHGRYKPETWRFTNIETVPYFETFSNYLLSTSAYVRKADVDTGRAYRYL
jgi:hypothetical protein